MLHPVAQQLAVGFRVQSASQPAAGSLSASYLCANHPNYPEVQYFFPLWLAQNESVSPTEFTLLGKVYFQGFYFFGYLFAQNGYPAYHSATTLQGGGGLVMGNVALRFLSWEVGGRLRTQHGILNSVGW